MAKAAAPAVLPGLKRGPLAALHRSGRNAAFGSRLLADSGNLERLSFERRECRLSLDWLRRLGRRRDWFRYRLGGSRDSAIRSGRRIHFIAFRLRRPLHFGLDRGHVVVLLKMFQEIADVQEGVAIEADVHKGRLHSRKNPGYSALVKTSN
jgi:hypothetical protein